MHRVLPLPTEEPRRSQARRTQSRVIEIRKPQRKRSKSDR
jgi:hypothetical protein